MKGPTNLQRVLESGTFAVTAECGPPRGADPEVVRRKGGYLKGWVDAVNVTDNQAARARMSSFAGALILKTMGLDPVMQMVCRDRNRIALQGDILGAAAWGIGNLLCLSGDHQKFGDQPGAKNVYDIDSIQLIWTARQMRDEGTFMSGEEIKGKPDLFIGCAENPFAEPLEIRALRLAKKHAAGAQFVQTQCVFNLPRFEEWMRMVRDLGLHTKIHILAGVMPVKSVAMARYMKLSVPGMDVPDHLIERLRAAPSGSAAEEGIRICIETIERVKTIEGVAGVHLMPLEWEQRVPEIVEACGLYPRPATV